MTPSILSPDVRHLSATLLALTLLLLATLPAQAQTVTPAASLAATDNVFEDRVELSWQIDASAIASGSYFDLTRDGTQIAVAGFDQRTYIDASAVIGTEYNYCVSVVSASGTASTQVCDTGRRTFRAPTGLTASDQTRENDVFIRWTDNSSIETGYRIERKTGSTVDATFDLGANVTSFLDASATAGTTYSYCLTARTGAGGTTATPEVCDNGTRANVTPPAAVSATDGLWTDRVRITWTDQSTSETGYKVYRGGTEIATLAANTTQYDDQPGASTTYCVAAVASAGESSLTAEGVCDAGSAGGLAAPTAVTASNATHDDRVEVAWTYDGPTGVTGFEVFRDGGTAPIDSAGGAARSFNDFSATPGTSYGYCVQAVSDQPGDAGGPSRSSQGCTTTNGLRAHVLPPSNATASNATLEDRVALAWNNTASSVMLFNVYRKTGQAGTVPTSTAGMTLIATPSFDKRTYDDKAINTDVLYDYCVTAVTVSAGSSSAQGRLVEQGQQAVSAYLSEQQETFSLQAQADPGTQTEAVARGAYGVLSSIGFETASLQESTPTCTQGSRSLRPPTSVAATLDTEETHVQVTWEAASATARGYRIYRSEQAEPTLGFDGNTTQIDIPNEGRFDFAPTAPVVESAPYTIEFWIRPNLTNTAGPAQPIIFKGTSWAIYIDGLGQVDHYRPNHPNIPGLNVHRFTTAFDRRTLSDSYRLPDVTWTHIAVTFNEVTTTAINDFSQVVLDRPNSIRVYINGQPGGLYDHNPNAFGRRPLGPLPQNNDPVQIGGTGGYVDSTIPFQGQLRDVRIWNYARSLQEIESTYAQRLVGLEPGLVANWLLNEGTGTVATDQAQAGGGNNGTITGPAWQQAPITQTLAGQVSASRSSFGDYGVASDVEHTYRVRTFDEYLPGTFAESPNGPYRVATDTTGRRTLVPPANVVASDSTFENKVVLTWEDASRGETGYEIYRDGVLLTTTAVGATTYTDTSPARGQLHTYSVRTVDASGASVFRSAMGRAVLKTPSNVEASDLYDEVVSKQVVIAWVDDSAHETGYEVWRDRTVNGRIDDAGADSLTTTTAGATSYADQTAATGALYEYCVRASDGSSRSGQACSTGRVTHAGQQLGFNNALTGLVASQGTFDDRIQLTWNDTSGETEYAVYRTKNEGELETGVTPGRLHERIATLGANVTSYNDLEAEPGNAYQYCVTGLLTPNPGNTGSACTTGWRKANGTISGRVATHEGGGTRGVEVQLSPTPNKALLFDGIGGNVQIPNANAGAVNFDAADDFTVEVWLNYTGTAGSGSDEPDIIEFWGSETTTGTGYPFVLRGASRNNAGQLSFARYDGTNSASVTTARTDLNDGTWHHIALVHDGAAKSMTLFVDGVQDATTTYTTLNSTVTTSDLFFGRRGGHDQNWFGGQMDEVRIWNVARSQADIQATMKTQLRGNEPGLAAYWPLNENSRAAADLTGGGANGLLQGGVHWNEGTAFALSATTDANGNYTFDGVHYGDGDVLSITPTHPTRSFTPASKTITLSTESPVQNEIGFIDETDFTLSGRVIYEYTRGSTTNVCPVPDVEVYVQEGQAAPEIKGSSESDGSFAVAVNPSDPGKTGDTRTLTLQKGQGDAAHVFAPTSFSYVADQNQAGLLFKDQRTQVLRGFIGGGGPSCLQDIGEVTLRVWTEDGCFDQSYTFGGGTNPSLGAYDLPLPPQRYLVDVSVSNIPSNLNAADVTAFFEALGTQEVDLTSGDASLDLIYRAPMVVAITGLPPQTTCTSGLAVKEGTTTVRTLPNVPVVTEDQALSLTIALNEDYGNGNLCPVTLGENDKVTVFDGIGDKDEPVELTIANGQATYQTLGNSPDVFSGRIVDGVDRSFQKSISVTAEIEGREPVTHTAWALVEGFRERTGAFASATTGEIPLLVVHDPPGSQSYAYMEKGTTFCSSISNMKITSDADGGYSDAVLLGFKAEVGSPFFASEIGAGLKLIGQVVGGKEQSRLSNQACTPGLPELGDVRNVDLVDPPEGQNCKAAKPNLEICVTTTETFATSDDPSAIQDDIYAGVALNLLFAKADNVQEASCEVRRTETTAADLNPDDAFETAYVYSNSFIGGVMIPELQGLSGLAGSDQALNGTLDGEATSLTLAGAIANWNKHLEANQTNIANGLKNAKNHSFSGGLVYEHSHTVDSTQAIKHNVDVAFSEAEGGLGVILSHGFESEFGLAFDVSTEFVTEEEADSTWSQTVGWVFDDGDGQDFFSVDVGSDPAYGTPVFGLKSGRTSNPCEPGTQCRDNPRIAVTPPERLNVPPDSAATFTLTLTNDSESGERREYVLAAPGEHNLAGAVLKVNGKIAGGNTFLIEPGQSVSATLSVERNPAIPNVFDYDKLALMIYPEDEYKIWRADMRAPFARSDTAFVNVRFASSCASVRLDELDQGWTYRSGDPALRMLVIGYDLSGEHVDGDLSQLTVGAEYRKLGQQAWTDLVRRSGRDLQAEGAPSFSASWTPEEDGQYEVRAYTQCGAASNRVATVPTVGTVDTHAPAVFAPEPKDGSLGIGDEARVIFDEDLACASVTGAAIDRLAGDGNVLETLENAQVTCEGRTVTVSPEGGWAQATDGERYRVRLLADGEQGPTDELGNTLQSDVTWQFVVQRADFSFNPVRLGAVTARGSERTLEVNLANGRTDAIDFSLGGLLILEQVDENDQPTGASVELAPSVQAGTIAGESQYPVQFALPPTLAVGTWRGQMTASGSSGGQSLGTVPFFTEVEVDCAAPSWHIGPAAFTYQMTAIAALSFGGVASADASDQLAAFVGGTLRSLASPSPDGKVYLTIFGDLPHGETVTFKAWQSSTCTLSDITQSTAFEADTFVDLGTLTPGAVEAQRVALSEGWTWFSLNRAADATALDQATAGLALESGDQIKSLSDGQSTFEAKEGWTGSLTALRLGQGYQIRLARGGVLKVPGASADATTPITLTEGVNWLGYLPGQALDVNTALASLRPTPGDQIRSQRAFAHYVAGTGWVGSLTEMAPGQGYVLTMAKEAVLSYPATSGAPQTAPATRMLAQQGEALQQVASSASKADEPGQAPGKRLKQTDEEGPQPTTTLEETWAVDTDAFGYAMTLTGTLDDKAINPGAIRLGAFIDGEARGSARLAYVEALQAYRFFLLVRSNEAKAQQVTFQLFDETTEEMIETDYSLAFTADAAHGTPEEPVTIAARRDASAEVPESYSLAQNYPNPFNPATTIQYALPEAAEVELVVYDLLGREVLTLVRAEQEAGRYEVVFDGRQLASGMYVYRITAGAYKAVKKMILVK